MKQVEVKILQQSYLLACKEGQETRLTEAVSLVDDAMTRIHDAGKVRARERIAVLAALNLAYELGDLRVAHAQLLEQLPAPIEAGTEEAADDSAFSQEAAADFNAQTLALQGLVARLEAVLNPAAEESEWSQPAAPQESAPQAPEAELDSGSALNAQAEESQANADAPASPQASNPHAQQAGFF